MRNRISAIGSANRANACSRVGATRRFIASVRRGERRVSCPAAMLVASFALAELGKASATARKRLREGGHACASALTKGASEASLLVVEVCGDDPVTETDEVEQ